MPEGPFGLNRPFVEESEQSQVVVYKFEDRFSKMDLREMAQIMLGRFNSEGIGVSDAIVDNGANNFISVKLLTTNLSIEEIESMRNIGMRSDGFEDMIVSTVLPGQIERLGGR